MKKEYYDANKNMRNYLKSKGFKYEKIQLHKDVSTFRFEMSIELDKALTEYKK